MTLLSTPSTEMDCPRCSKSDVLEIDHVLPDGIEVRFFWCHSCEEKWWNRDGVDIDIAQVLEIVRQNRA
jgi:transposase-like protein